MNGENIDTISTAAPSVTIAVRSPARGVLLYVVTLTEHKSVRAYPCRSIESATNLAQRFIQGLVKASQPKDASQNPHVYNGKPRTAEEVAA